MKRRDVLIACAGGGSLMLLPSAAISQVADLNDAINKAGRQRMLSQRMAKSYLAAGQGVVPELADRTLAASMTLFDRQLIELKVFAPQAEIKATYVALESAWNDYKMALMDEKRGKQKADALLAIAGKVLKLAHDGTAQLENVSAKPLGKLVNICGRQRMLSQRMAAFYLSACWGVQVSSCTTELNRARDEFVAAHELLKKAPEITRAIKTELELAETQWNFFDVALRGLRTGSSDKRAMSEVFTTSERILQVMDGVTGMYSKLS